MAYTTRAKVEALIPPDILLRALDDNSDGVEDTGLFDTILGVCSTRADDAISQRYPVPRDPPEPMLQQATLVFVLEAIYLRRGLSGEANPWSGHAKTAQDKLDAIGRGEGSLGPEAARTKPPVSVISEESKLHTSNGQFL